MRLVAYKFLVTPVLQEVDGGIVVGERGGETDTVFGLDALTAYAAGFQGAVDQANEQLEAAQAAKDEG